MRPVKVLVVDDSPLIRRWLVDIVEGVTDMQVVETASDGSYVLDKVKKYRPDIITLDINMPKMNGLTALKHLMISHPSRVLIVSSLAKSDAEITLQALRLGALDFITKPVNLSDQELEKLKRDVLIKMRSISNIDPQNIKYRSTTIQKSVQLKIDRKEYVSDFKKIVVIGSSTGGPIALEDILMRLPVDFPYPILIAQHLPVYFSNSFAANLDRSSNLKVKGIENYEYIKRGFVYIAPGGYNLRLKKDGKGIYSVLIPVKKEYGIVSPSVDQLFSSAAEATGENVIACLLTGIGNDGTQGIRKIRENGGVTIAQDKESSMVYSMPLHAIKSGLVQHVMPLGRIPDFLVAKAMYFN